MELLEYENQIFLDAYHEDGLLVMARGLGIERIFASFLKLYSDPGNLVLVLNTTGPEEEYFMELLQKQGTKPLPKSITNEYSVSERHSVYLEGGVLFITSRILVVDMLTERIPIHLISGILVYKAHRIIESCQEAFILRLYRQKNKTGFVKAFSESPLSFTAGFCHVERVMKSLFVRKLFLWPRFQASVLALLDKHQVDVVELSIPLTSAMVSCQAALLALISGCIKELKTCNSTLDTDEVTVENALTRDFEKVVRLHLDPVWHQLGAKTRQLVTDINTLRLLMEYLTQYDCVNFYNLVKSVRTNERTFGSNSGWLFMNEADTLFMHARTRVFGEEKKDKKKESKNKNEEPELEECPKWTALLEVLEEIRQENEEREKVKKESGEEEEEPGRVLVAAADDRTCNQIKEVLCEGGRNLLLRLYNKTVDLKQAAQERQAEKVGRGKGQGKKFNKAPNTLTLTQMIDSDGRSKGKPEDEACEAGGSGGGDDNEDDVEDGIHLSSASAYRDVVRAPVTVLHPLRGSPDPASLARTLHELQPRYVVLYDADMQFVRQLEVFKARRPGKPLRVYFLMYESSTEEQRYLTSLRKEKEAFEYLIREKATMVIPEEREGRMEDDLDLARGEGQVKETNSRKGGLKQKEKETQRVIVDMREFRSELPSLIHRRGIDIEPVTIEVGDYILTPDVCVERKSVSDLIGSLNNGRLYNQAVAMCRYYKRPVLLIEFDPNKPFTLQGKQVLSPELNSTDTISRLTLLTLHFPRLRVLWCQSPYATAELFHEIKKGYDQPNAGDAMKMGVSETDIDLSRAKFNYGPYNMLLKMPGIDLKNIHRVVSKVSDFKALLSLSESELSTMLESERNARSLYDFLHAEHSKTDDAVAGGSTKAGGKRMMLNKFGAGGKRKR